MSAKRTAHGYTLYNKLCNRSRAGFVESWSTFVRQVRFEKNREQCTSLLQCFTPPSSWLFLSGPRASCPSKLYVDQSQSSLDVHKYL